MHDKLADIVDDSVLYPLLVIRIGVVYGKEIQQVFVAERLQGTALLLRLRDSAGEVVRHRCLLVVQVLAEIVLHFLYRPELFGSPLYIVYSRDALAERWSF